MFKSRFLSGRLILQILTKFSQIENPNFFWNIQDRTDTPIIPTIIIILVQCNAMLLSGNFEKNKIIFQVLCSVVVSRGLTGTRLYYELWSRYNLTEGQTERERERERERDGPEHCLQYNIKVQIANRPRTTTLHYLGIWMVFLILGAGFYFNICYLIFEMRHITQERAVANMENNM